jgi:hypothetical protein
VRRCGSRATSSEAETCSGARVPSSEADIRPRGRQALERSREFVVWRLALERGGGLNAGHRDWLLDGSLRLFGPWALPCLGPQPHLVCFVVCGLFVRFYYF